MFTDNKKKGQQNLSSQQNKIAEGTRIIGDIISEGGFRIDGIIEGNVKTSSKVVIGKKGSIQGITSEFSTSHGFLSSIDYIYFPIIKFFSKIFFYYILLVSCSYEKFIVTIF